MKIFKLSLSALLLASLFISCDKGNDNPPAPKGGEGSFKGVVFAAGITNPEGNGGNVYMQALPSFLPGTYGNMVFNPTTMKKIADIDLNSYAQEGARVSPAAMIIRDGKLFVGLSQMNSQFMPTVNKLEFAMIDTKTDKVEKHIVNESLGMCYATRPIDAGSIFMDENKDLYFNCMGSFGMLPQLHGGIARIKNGSTDIDPNYSIRLDQTEVSGLSTKHADYICTVMYAGDGKVYTYISSLGLDPHALDNPYLTLSNLPVVIDLKQRTLSVIKNTEISNPQGIAVAKYKDLIVFGSANKKATGFYTYNPKTKEVAGPVIQTQGNPSFFHSFE